MSTATVDAATWRLDQTEEIRAEFRRQVAELDTAYDIEMRPIEDAFYTAAAPVRERYRAARRELERQRDTAFTTAAESGYLGTNRKEKPR